MDYREIEEGWSKIHNGMNEMIKLANNGPNKLPKELYVEMYNHIYNMCTKQPSCADQIYKRYGMTVDDYLREHVLPLVRNKTRTNLLEELLRLYPHHKTLVKWLGSVFSYLDRHYASMLKLTGMKEMAWNSFRFLVVDPCIDNIRDAMLEIIEDNRRGVGNKDKMKLVGQSVKFLIEIGKNVDFYKQNFENHLVRKSVQYYKEQKQRLKFENPDYTQKAEEFIIKERDWVREYFHPSSEIRLLDLCCTTLLGTNYVLPAESQKPKDHQQPEDEEDDVLCAESNLLQNGINVTLTH